ncbi:PKD domain-containing protein [Roseivirga sp. BDSF3-8]|uniref:PKD domain-containing protein n=1 Tax=Roseivirga sp. BDSF3-8 TaxID=3241598 RepID=UPI003531F0D0
MTGTIPISRRLVFLVLFLLPIQAAFAQVTISRTVSQVELCPAYSLRYLGIITLSESINDDFQVGEDQTLVLELPDGLTFNEPDGMVNISGANISNVVYFVSGSKLFLKYDITGPASFPRDEIQLSGFRVISSAEAQSGNLLRSGGTAVINGGAIADNLVYASIKIGDAKADAGIDKEICLGSSTQIGTAGQAGFTYSWTPSSTLDDPSIPTPVASPSSRTTYTLTVTDGQGCQATDKVVVNVKPLPVATITPSGSIDLCQGDNVVLMAAPSSGTYLWSNGARSQGITVSSAGNYSVKITENGCTSTSNPVAVTLSTPAGVSVSSPESTVCYDHVSLSASATLSGGASSGSWVGGDGSFSNPTGLTTLYTIGETDREAGQVTLTFTTNDPAGSCESASDNLSITINPPLSANAGSNQTICRGESVALGGSTIASGGDGHYQFEWSGPEGYTSESAAPLITPSTSGTYQLTLTDGQGCSATDQVTININEPAGVKVLTQDEALCPGATSIAISGELSGGASSSSWWGGSGSFADANALNTTYFISPDDISDGQIKLFLMTDDPAGNCEPATDSLTIFFYPKIQAYAGSDATICLGESIELGGQPIVNGGTGNYTYSWTGPDGFTSGKSNPVIQPQSPGTFEYVLSIRDGAGCQSDNDVIRIIVNDQVTVDAGPDQITCQRDREILLEAQAGNGYTGGLWSTAGTGLFANASDLITTYSLSDDDVAAGSVKLTYEANDSDGSGPCSSASDYLSITIRSEPEVAFAGLNDQYAENEPVVTLTGFPSGGTFSGNGIISGTSDFDPGAAELGLNEIIYTYQDTYGCVNADTQIVVINSVPEIAFGLEGRDEPQVCIDEGPQRLVYDETQNGVGTFSGVGVDPDPSGDFYFDPSISDQGVHKVVFRFETFDPPTTSEDTLIIQVYENPDASFTYDQYVCEGDEVAFTNQSTMKANLFNHSITGYHWDYGNGIQSSGEHGLMTYAEPGQYVVTLTVFSEACENSISNLITVGGSPTAEFRWEDISEGNVTRFFDQTEDTTDPFSTVTSWQWNFGDPGSQENTSNEEFPTHTFSEAGEFTVTLTVTMNTGCQATISHQVQILPSVVTYPYFQDFETTAGWVPAEGSSWELGTPSGTNINQPFSGARSWVTNLDGEYPNSAQGYINGPDFDLTVLARPMLSFYYQGDLQRGFDGVVMQYSLDGGRSWEVLGKPGDGYNWYNASSLVGNPGDQDIGQYGWSGQLDWQRGALPLNSLKERTSVRLRLAFGSDPSNPPNTTLEGFAFDDIYIGERSRQVLAEHFIDGYGTAGLEANQVLGQLQAEVPLDIIQLQYRSNIQQSSDSLFLDARDDISSRISYYGITEPLRSVIDGNYLEDEPASLNSQEILRRSLIDPVFEISLDTINLGPHQLGIEAAVTAIKPYEEEVVLQLAIVEAETPVNISGNVNVLNYVVKKLLPNAGGNSFTRNWQPGESEMITETWQVDNIDNPTQLRAVAFVQNKATREILQTVTIPLSPKSTDIIEGLINQELTPYLKETVMYPNPADDKLVVDFNGPVKESLNWSLIDPASRQLAAGQLRQAADYLEINTGRMKNGLYFLVLYQGTTPVYYEKVIIRHQ